MLPPNISEVLRAGLMNRYIHATLNLMALIATRITLEHGQASYSRGIYSLEICILALTRQLSGREFRVVVRTGQVDNGPAVRTIHRGEDPDCGFTLAVNYSPLNDFIILVHMCISWIEISG